MDFTFKIMVLIFLPLFLTLGYLGASILEKYGDRHLIAKIIGYLLTLGFTPLYAISCLYYFEYYTIILLILVFVVVMFYIKIFTL